MAVLIGLDVGTTNTKAVAVDPAQRSVVAVSARPTPYTGVDGTREIDPEELWRAVVATLREVMARVETPVVVGVASMAESGVPMDAAGRPLYRIIPWYDVRTEPQLRRVLGQVSADQLFQITGQASRHVYTLYKLLWLRDNHPERFAALARWLSVSDYVAYRLTGEAATDYSLASRTMLFDQRARAWSPELLALAGLRTDQLPRVLPSGEPAGRVTASAAAETGLTRGIPVAVGGHDHLCGALAAGAVEPGEIVDSMGTAESLVFPTARYWDDPRLGRGRICSYAHVVPGLFTVQGGMAMSGGALAWVADQLFADAVDPVAAALAAAEKAPVGSDTLLYYPYLGGNGAPVGDENLAACFLGLRPEHRREHLVRAVLEGTSFAIRDILDTFGSVMGETTRAIRVVGGGSRSSLWLKIRASVLDRPIEAVDVPEAVAVGAALLAGLGVGAFASARDAAEAIHREVVTFRPEPGPRERYDLLYRDGYRGLYPAMAPVFAAISALRAKVNE